MSDRLGTPVAIVDYGMGNLFSVLRACQTVGLEAEITNSTATVRRASAIILPGVGAFGVAMDNLRDLGLIEVIRAAVDDGKPLLGICLGMQLLMAESWEFGHREGLGIIQGDVVKLPEGMSGGCRLKVPQVGWNGIRPVGGGQTIERAGASCWNGTVLQNLTDGDYFYFTHSYYCRPADSAILALTEYGSLPFCSAIRRDNVQGCQFHPERSGPQGLQMYKNFASIVDGQRMECHRG
jgi:imidazole glycerol-phosphate synthase subunit HisH